MKIEVCGSVSGIYVPETDHEERTYYTMTDITGGEIKFTVAGHFIGVKVGDGLRILGEFNARADKSGGVYLNYLYGSVKKVKITVEETEEDEIKDKK